MESAINKLFEYYDSIFFDEKVEVDHHGSMGTHYNGLIFDEYLSNSIFSIDYLSIEDYFETVTKVKYCETESLFSQYSHFDIEIKLTVISAILTLVNSSTYNEDGSIKEIGITPVSNLKKEFISLKNALGYEKALPFFTQNVAQVLGLKNTGVIKEGIDCDLKKKKVEGRYRSCML